MTFVWLFLPRQTAQHVSSPYLHLDPVVSVAQVLQVGGGVGLDRGEVMLQHVDDLGQLGVTPSKLPDGKERKVSIRVAHLLRSAIFGLFVRFCSILDSL